MVSTDLCKNSLFLCVYVCIGKEVDDVEEVTCFSGSNKGSNSEVQSLSSYQSDSGDDNGMSIINLTLVTVVKKKIFNSVLDTSVQEDIILLLGTGKMVHLLYSMDTSELNFSCWGGWGTSSD